MDSQEASNFVLGVDLDGVCADFMAGLRPIAAEWLGVREDELTEHPSHNYPEWRLDAAGGFDALYRFAATRRDLFATVPTIPGASLTLRRLWTSKRVRIRVITFRLYFEFFHQVAIRQTIEWLDQHDFPYWDICFMKDKAAVGADLYVEDSESNIRALRAADKKVIVFNTPQNRDADLAGPRASTWSEVEQLVLEEIESWEQSQPAGGPERIAGD
jgi:5'(3')-deoxyribonucleotidase